MSPPLELVLRKDGDDLVARFTNTGHAPLALTFWWTRRLHVEDAAGVVVAEGGGPVLPCGAAEDWTLLAPGEHVDRPQPLQCTQPAGGPDDVGWSYALPAGRYRVSLVVENPPRHGFTQSEPHPQAFVGRVQSNVVEIDVAPAAKGLLARLFGG